MRGWLQNAEADARREADLIALDQAKTSFFSSISHVSFLSFLFGVLAGRTALTKVVPGNRNFGMSLVSGPAFQRFYTDSDLSLR